MPPLHSSALRALKNADVLAHELGQRTDSAHLLGGLLTDDGVVGELLGSYLTVEDVRMLVRPIVVSPDYKTGRGAGIDVVWTTTEAGLIATRHGDTEILPLHLLLAILENVGGVGWAVIDGIVSPEHLHAQVLDLLRAGQRHARVGTLGRDDVGGTVAEFEPPIAALTNLAQSGALAEWDEEFVRNTIQQIHLWRERDEANPQIFELLVADVVKKLLDRLTDPAPLRASLLQCGADEALAHEVSRRVSETVRSMTQLGDDDAERDADLLAQIAESTERTAAAVEGLDLKRKSLPRRAAEQAALGAVGAVGKEAATAALHQLKNLLTDEWPKVQIGLMLAWRAVKDRFVA